MLAHGKFRVETQGRIVHTYPEEGFNEEGIRQYCLKVLEQGNTLQSWLLFEHPRNLAAVTSEAEVELSNAYRLFESAGCVAIACEVGPVYRDMVQNQLGANVSIPVLASDNMDALNQFLEQHSQ
ncbi:hypothetical protein HMF8227_00169 [Saliniradius amylolyticus]|uniref:Uncharacterized protein n=1 Tax=Saliniradius amylolyticus TaxID=2183582 RepID=A0A2S2E0X4_9ALTE|nr:hypothetical protein [Saliniradius amylolyticus]AWL10677.1 hypothetical protein HMF8227_00169 [Saliniradius amylolyticus]